MYEGKPTRTGQYLNLLDTTNQPTIQYTAKKTSEPKEVVIVENALPTQEIKTNNQSNIQLLSANPINKTDIEENVTTDENHLPDWDQHLNDKNLSGKNGLARLLPDMIANYFLGNILGPAIIKGTEKTAEPIIEKTKFKDESTSKLLANLSVGSAGFGLAEVILHKIDPFFNQILEKSNNLIQDKFGEQADRMNNLAKKYVSALFGYKKFQNNTDSKNLFSEELKQEIDDYLLSGGLNQKTDPYYRENLNLKIMKAKFKKYFGKEMPELAKKTISQFQQTSRPGHCSKHLLLSNELALVMKPILNKIKGLGNIIFNTMYYLGPNSYILVAKPIAEFINGEVDRHLYGRAKQLNVRVPEAYAQKEH